MRSKQSFRPCPPEPQCEIRAWVITTGANLPDLIARALGPGHSRSIVYAGWVSRFELYSTFEEPLTKFLEK